MMFPDPDWIAKEQGNPDNISTEAWVNMGRAGVTEVPEGMTDAQFREYLNQKFKEKHKTKMDLF